LIELFPRVLAQQSVPKVVPPTGHAAQQRLVRQGHQITEGSTGDCLGSLPGETTTKDRQCLQDLLLSLGEQIPRVVEESADAALPRRYIA
jgi:hypothetical protein